jgi:alkaline phosphatase D
MSLTRRQFLWSTAATAVLRPDLLYAQTDDPNGSNLFRHGVASGDPLPDRVILWTRITPAIGSSQPIEVRWTVASDATLSRVVARGTARAIEERDFTVKVDAAGLMPGRPYYYAFEAAKERSAVGRTKTLPDMADRLRFASVSCSNYPSGYFNVYRRVAERDDLDAVIHVGDYIYEFQNGTYGDGSSLLRIPEPRKEAVTLSDYRIRYATYRTDPDLQEAHRVHPFIAVWDDHEITNDAWAHGATNHNPELGEGDWETRQAAAYRAYLEWMPIREPLSPGIRLYRSFRFGTLADLVMLDTRGLRDKQAPRENVAAIADPMRTMLGGEQEQWLFDQLRASQQADVGWRIVGQQVLFARLAPPGRPVISPDLWDGYPAARDRIFDFLSAEKIRDVAVLSGDLHSSWALDLPRDPWNGYQRATGEGSLGVELLTPAISSPPLFETVGRRDESVLLRAVMPHLKLLEGDSRGYVLLDITRKELRGDWYFVPTVLEHSSIETKAAAFVCEKGSAHLESA